MHGFLLYSGLLSSGIWTYEKAIDEWEVSSDPTCWNPLLRLGPILRLTQAAQPRGNQPDEAIVDCNMEYNESILALVRVLGVNVSGLRKF